jgi:protoporphyrinogen oxidase
MRVAVVGSGVTGLAATWVRVFGSPCHARPLDDSPTIQLLNEYSPHEVHLYEADDRPGGHANTVYVAQPGKEPVDVDTCVDTSTAPSRPHTHAISLLQLAAL